MRFENQGNVFPMLKQTTYNEDVWEIGDLAAHILSPGTRWRGVVSFISRSLYSRGLSSRYPLVQSLGGPQTRNVWRKLAHFILNSVQLISVYSGDCKGISLWHGYGYILVVSYRLDLRSYSFISQNKSNCWPKNETYGQVCWYKVR